ncbi:poly(ADP-ribose) glycohydrolase [Cardiosporidium cionae]|uniref:poly(ADP-ribose) glycohydrolase n=1 Tax=Cardiosporidium cionae TaxID=476202 RepID=A0ABQ7J4L7_9APIC|nr:poly(ADP-ribose) glycohydrolase [Cardiosporidium cionae]|eukprot:KAF8818150.1 poly(ADP-ribose) glycohydrolase [Cardiosporidium cionae]
MALPLPAPAQSMLIRLYPAADSWNSLSQELWEVYQNPPFSNATELHTFIRRCGNLVGNLSLNDTFRPGTSALLLFDEEHPRAPCSKQHLYTKLIPFMAAMASKLPYFFPKGLPILRQGVVELQAVELTKMQVCALLSAAFFAIIPFEQNGIPAKSVFPTVSAENEEATAAVASSLPDSEEDHFTISAPPTVSPNNKNSTQLPPHPCIIPSHEATSHHFSSVFSFASSADVAKGGNRRASSAEITAKRIFPSLSPSPFFSPVSKHLQHFDLITTFMTLTEKCFCLMAYFVRMYEFASSSIDRVASLGESLYWNDSLFSKEPILNEKIGFYRRSTPLMGTQEEWKSCTRPLQEIHMEEAGFIEEAEECLQTDFANKYIGGGVLTHGYLQEEIRFLAYPENLVTLLFTERMSDAESIITVGAERFSDFTGYAHTFQFSGISKKEATTSSFSTLPPIDGRNRPALDDRHRLPVHLTAFDALQNPRKNQYTMTGLLRELRKSFCAFSGDPFEIPEKGASLMPVATGNWGCGAFRGDPQLKGLIQWLAASAVGRSVRYFPVKNKEITSLASICEALCQISSPPTVGEAFGHLKDALEVYLEQRQKRSFSRECGVSLSVFECIQRQISLLHLSSFSHVEKS